MIPPKAEPLPKVTDAAWPRNGIDFWILARLEKEGLQPSPEADPYTLLRRVEPRPPRPAADARGARAIRRTTRPRAPTSGRSTGSSTTRPTASGGPRMWLDLARYADSAGYGSDPLRTIWRYRDWVIDAFNRNLPYDQFTIEQIAGDLLPDPTLDQKMATAFHRNTMTNTEGGTDDEEFRVAAIKDRVDTTMQVWMGLTMGCAKCHSHKYDPITQEEYYQFYAIFNQTADTDQPDESPVIPVPTAGDQRAGPEDRRPDRRAEGAARARPTPALATAQVDVGGGAWPIPTHAAARKDVPKEILAILDTPAAKRTKEQAQIAGKHFRSIAPELKPLRDEIARLEKARPEIPTLPVMVELPQDKRRVTQRAPQGQLPRPRRAGRARRAQALHPLPAGARRSNRLALASWLVDPKNPLTARVAVNRFWAQLFGTGLVETEEDFGTQGELPSHPELLDWLAVRVHGARAGTPRRCSS